VADLVGVQPRAQPTSIIIVAEVIGWRAPALT